MKRTPLKRLGKRGRQWYNDRKELKIDYERRGIVFCELKLNGCFGDNYLGFAHRHKRSWYYKHPELLKDFNQTLLACAPCHDKIEDDKELTEKMFKKLRG